MLPERSARQIGGGWVIKLNLPFVESAVLSERACLSINVSSGIGWKQSVGSLACVKVLDQTNCHRLLGDYAPTQEQK